MVRPELNHDHTEKFLGRGNAKVILFGEHSVVYGSRAIACGIEEGASAWLKWHDEMLLRVVDHTQNRTEFRPDPNGSPLEQAFAVILEVCGVDRPFRVDVRLTVPPGAGLGSSAALAVSMTRAMRSAFELEPQTVVDAVAASEKVFHQNPSGVDETVALRGGLLAYQIGVGSVPVQVDGTSFWVVANPQKGASTAKMVAGVRALREQTETAFEHLILAMEEIAGLAQTALQNHELERVGRLMDMNHGALVSLGVSTARLDEICWRTRELGALGAKLTGAGGGGCVLALAKDEAHSKLLGQFFEQHGIWSKTVTIGES